jgi:hypothetical protein
MQSHSPTYSVVLRSDIPAREREFFIGFCCEITSPQGASLLHFLCTKIDVSHHSYIEMETFHPSDQELSIVRVPHNFVLLILGSEERPSIGF